MSDKDREQKQYEDTIGQLHQQSVVTMKVANLVLHPESQTIPSMRDGERWELYRSIHGLGILEPLVVVSEDGVHGRVADGRSRLEQAQNLGLVEVPCRIVPDDEKLPELVFALNVPRRHLDTTQRAIAAANHLARQQARNEAERKQRQREGGKRGGQRSAANRRGEAEGIEASGKIAEGSEPSSFFNPVAEAAIQYRVSERTVRDAAFLRKHHPDLLAAAAHGKKTISAAAKDARRIDDRRRRVDEHCNAGGKFADLLERRAAYHEAGHAVVCLLLGGDVSLVDITPTTEGGKEYGGITICNTPHDLPDHFRLENQIMINEAGEVAAQKACGSLGDGGTQADDAHSKRQMRNMDPQEVSEREFEIAWAAGLVDKEALKKASWVTPAKRRHLRVYLRSLTTDILVHGGRIL
jgi:ParB-like chromosome segregation protein Spo0J